MSTKKILPLPDIQSVFYQLIQQLIEIFPIIDIWIAYRNPHQQERLWIYSCEDSASNLSSPVLSYLKSEKWLTEDLPNNLLIKLSLFNQIKCPENLPTNLYIKDLDPLIHIYVYCFYEEPKDEYVLILTSQDLSLPQKIYLQNQVELVYNYLVLALASDYQIEEIKLLKQAVRQSEHQLRNSLSLIQLYAENLFLGLPNDSLQEYADIIRQTSVELNENLSKLFDFFCQDKIQVSVYNLEMLFEETIAILKSYLEDKKLVIEYPKKPAILAVDGWQIKQVFENLLSNAIAFSPSGGIITCNWQIFKTEVLVQIRDRGPGIAPEDLDKIFNPFYTKRPGGTGLGLTIAKKIILAHRGSIWAENLLDGGALFSFTLPGYT